MRPMGMVRELFGRGKQVWLPLGIAAFLAYSGYHALEGHRGLKSWSSVTQEIKTARAELQAAKAERAEWEQRVARLRGDRPNTDLLDERARHMLNFAHPDDIVIFYDRPLATD